MARKKKSSPALLIASSPANLAHDRGALVPNERKLSFGDRWAYAPAPEQSDYLQLKPRYQLFINGKFHGMICPATPNDRG
ncbi:MAG: hypothetical protein ACR2MW_11535, partial [Chthoniobacterales bacterium]